MTGAHEDGGSPVRARPKKGRAKQPVAADDYSAYTLALLVAAGYVTQAKVDEARAIALNVKPGPLEPAQPAGKVRVTEAAHAVVLADREYEQARQRWDSAMANEPLEMPEDAFMQAANRFERALKTKLKAVAALEAALAAQPAVPEGFVLSVIPVVVSDAPDAHRVQFKVGAQQFHVGPDYFDTKDEAEWYAEQFHAAIAGVSK